MSHRLVKAITVIDDGEMAYAEMTRRIAALADELGLPRPNYETVRRAVIAERRWQARKGPTTAEVLLDISFRARPPSALLDHLVDDLPGPPEDFVSQ